MEKRGRNQFFLPRHSAKLSIKPSSFGMSKQTLSKKLQDLDTVLAILTVESVIELD